MEAHDHVGHQGVEQTLARLMENACWVGMAKDVGKHCKHCFRCQTTNAQANKPVPIQSVMASRHWEVMAVDILKVPHLYKVTNTFWLHKITFRMALFALAMPEQ